MLNVSHLTKKYHRFTANDNLSFTVADGETAVLAGPNGAGKSTAIKCIAGLLRFEGEIELCGFKNKKPLNIANIGTDQRLKASNAAQPFHSVVPTSIH